jgi:hypothetical protein
MAAQSLHHSGRSQSYHGDGPQVGPHHFPFSNTRQEFDDSHFAADQLRFSTISWIPGYGSDSSRLTDSRKFVVAANLASESLASL